MNTAQRILELESELQALTSKASALSAKATDAWLVAEQAHRERDELLYELHREYANEGQLLRIMIGDTVYSVDDDSVAGLRVHAVYHADSCGLEFFG